MTGHTNTVDLKALMPQSCHATLAQPSHALSLSLRLSSLVRFMHLLRYPHSLPVVSAAEQAWEMHTMTVQIHSPLLSLSVAPDNSNRLNSNSEIAAPLFTSQISASVELCLSMWGPLIASNKNRTNHLLLLYCPSAL